MIYPCYLRIYLSLTMFTLFVFWDRQVDFFSEHLFSFRKGSGVANELNYRGDRHK
jgi:hypothetical protein